MDLTKLAAWGVAALLAVIAASRVLGGPGEPPAAPVAVESPPGDTGAGQAADGAGGPPSGRGADAPGSADGLHVHVAGEVRRPGVYRVAAGSRVGAAVDAAGGMGRRADPAGVNLAAPLTDGQQVVVPQRGRAGVAGASEAESAVTGAAGSGDGLISLSTATVAELETLDGIGPALAARIVDYRDAHGGFRSVEELQEVDGIGEKRLAALRDAVRP